MLAIMGHMSRAMLERYSHITMAAFKAGHYGFHYSSVWFVVQ